MPVEITSQDAAETLTVERLTVERFPVGPHRANAYLVYSADSRHGVVIDPGAEGDILMARVDELGIDVRSVLLTHGHWDHVGAAAAVAGQTGAAVHIHPLDLPLLKAAPIYAFRIDGVRLQVPSAVQPVEEASVVPLDAHHALTTRHVPVHTPGGVAYRIGRVLFTGDTWLAAGASRVDLPGGDAEALGRSVARLLVDLAADDVVCPGHGRCADGVAAKEWVTDRQAAR
jgi:hydroxyacylglutathione hydrolase